MRAVAEPDRRRGAADFLAGDDVLEIAEAEPAIFLRHGDAVQAERAHFGPQFHREPVLGVDPRRQRLDPLLGEPARGVADHVRGLAELEIETGIHVRLLCRGR